MNNQNPNSKKTLNEGYQPIQKGFSPKPISSQVRPPKGGTGESSSQENYQPQNKETFGYRPTNSSIVNPIPPKGGTGETTNKNQNKKN